MKAKSAKFDVSKDLVIVPVRIEID